MTATTMQESQIAIRLVLFPVYKFINIILPPYAEKILYL